MGRSPICCVVCTSTERERKLFDMLQQIAMLYNAIIFAALHSGEGHLSCHRAVIVHFFELEGVGAEGSKNRAVNCGRYSLHCCPEIASIALHRVGGRRGEGAFA